MKIQNLFTTETQRHRESQNQNQSGFVFSIWVPLCLCVSDEATSHSTRLTNDASQVAGYVVEVFNV